MIGLAEQWLGSRGWKGGLQVSQRQLPLEKGFGKATTSS
jgi:hypothetical protein